MKGQEEIIALLDKEVEKIKKIIKESESELDALEYFVHQLVANWYMPI